MYYTRLCVNGVLFDYINALSVNKALKLFSLKIIVIYEKKKQKHKKSYKSKIEEKQLNYYISHKTIRHKFLLLKNTTKQE